MEVLKIRRSQAQVGVPVKVEFTNASNGSYGEVLLPFSVWMLFKRILDTGYQAMLKENKDFPLKILIEGYQVDATKEAKKPQAAKPPVEAKIVDQMMQDLANTKRFEQPKTLKEEEE